MLGPTSGVCVDAVVPVRYLEEARRHAVRANPANDLRALRAVGRSRVPAEELEQARFLPPVPAEILMEYQDHPIVARLAVWSGKRWPNGSTIHVGFLNGEQGLWDRVQRYASAWCQYANLKFAFTSDPRSAVNADVRVAFGPPYLVYQSAIGTDSRLRQFFPQESVHLGFPPGTQEDEYRRVILHEFGHVLGAIHEHQSPGANIPWNVAAVYAFYLTKIGWDQQKTYDNVLKRYDGAVISNTEFDRDSIMLYPISEDLTIGNFSTDWNYNLSSTDQSFIAQMYPGASGGNGGTTSPTGSTSGSTDLSVNAAPVAFTLPEGQVGSYAFESQVQGNHRIDVRGANLTVGLFGPSDDSQEIEATTTFDQDAVITEPLEPGRYFVKVKGIGFGASKYTVQVRRAT